MPDIYGQYSCVPCTYLYIHYTYINNTVSILWLERNNIDYINDPLSLIIYKNSNNYSIIQFSYFSIKQIKTKIKTSFMILKIHFNFCNNSDSFFLLYINNKNKPDVGV